MKNQDILGMSSPTSEPQANADRGTSAICAAQCAAALPDPRRAGLPAADAAGMTEKGSVLIIILVAVALFAALSFALMQGSRTTGNLATEQNAKLAASEILSFANALKSAVHTLRINGCPENQISFESPITGAIYTNTNSAPNTCKVFNRSGGGLNHIAPPALGKTLNSTWHRGYGFYARSAVQGVGTAAPELYMWIRTRSKELCMAYNNLVGVTNTSNDAPIDGGFSAGFYFTGTFFTASTVSGSGALDGKMTGCHKDSGESDTDGVRYYDIYQVLIPR